jgi:hypothetical protein
MIREVWAYWKPLYYASGLVLAFVIGGVTVRPFKAPAAPALGYGGGLLALTTSNDETPPNMGIIMCGVDGTGEIRNWYFNGDGLHGARITVSGECDTNHGPHPRHPQ